MHTEILDNRQKELLPYLILFQRKFYLVGGTAIALHIGHRRSLDYDLFCLPPFNKSGINNKLYHIPFKKKRIYEDTDQIHFFINEVKITFFCFIFPIKHPVKIKGFPAFPSLLTLASMKAYALGRRAKWKDYVDLYFILKDHYSIEEISIEGYRNFGQLYSEKLFREQLAYHKDIDYSEPVDYLIPAPSENEIREFLINKALDIGIK